jgi:hypothetical protein
LGFVLLSVLSSGCLAVETRRAHDPYYEHDHMWCTNYGIGFEGARVATLSALTHLKMPVYEEGPLRHGIFTPDNLEARVIITRLGRHGEGTRIGVRATGFGTHREVSERLLDEITRHLDAGQQAAGIPIASGPPPAAVLPESSPTGSGPSPSQSSEPSLPLQRLPVEK